MQHNRLGRRTLLPLLVACAALLTVGGGSSRALASSGWARTREPLQLTEVIQVEQLAVASEFGGRVLTIATAEGERVVEGQVLVQLDTALLDARISELQASLAMAQAGLAQARAGARPGELAVAAAQLQQAQAGELAARQAVSDTQALVDNPQDIGMQIAVTRAQLELARHQEAQAIALKDAVEIALGQFDQARAKYGNGGEQGFRVASGQLSDLDTAGLPDELRDGLPPDPSLLPDGKYELGDFVMRVSDGGFKLYKVVNISYPLSGQLLPNTYWQAWVGVNAAGAHVAALEGMLLGPVRQAW